MATRTKSAKRTKGARSTKSTRKATRSSGRSSSSGRASSSNKASEKGTERGRMGAETRQGPGRGVPEGESRVAGGRWASRQDRSRSEYGTRADEDRGRSPSRGN